MADASGGDLILLVLLFLFGSGKKASAQTAASADDDGEKLVRRANQQAALDWIPIFENEGIPSSHAEALARWAGLESSGNPHLTSTIGERGLFQLGEADQKMGALTDTEWAALINPATTNQQHAHMAARQADWLWKRAAKYIADPPDVETDAVSGIWYAYLEQQRPADVHSAKLHGSALPMARELAQRWQGDAAKMHRLRAANVVAFGVPNP